MQPRPRDASHMDHDAWTSGLLAAATGTPHPLARSILALRGDVEAAARAMPRSLSGAARKAARGGVAAMRETLRDGTLDLDVTVRDTGGRTWVGVAHGDASLVFSVEPLGRSVRTGVVRAIDAPADLARSMLRGLRAAWADPVPLTLRSPPRENPGPDPSTTAAEAGQITMRCNR